MYSVGDKVSFQVREVKSEGGNLYFIIHPGGFEQDVKAFDFQRGVQLPYNLDCYCRAIRDNGEPVFMQDIAKVLAQLYKIGESYEFRVKNDVTAAGYYEVIDSNGLVCRLSDYGRAKLHVNQVVTCEVKDINLVRMQLKLLSERTDRGIPFYDMDKVIALSGPEPDRVERYLVWSLLKKLSMFSEAWQQYQSGNSLWLMTAVDVSDRYLAEWLTSDLPRKEQLLRRFNQMCVNLLEHSDYLRNSTEQERIEYQDKLSKSITHTNDYLEALEHVAHKKDTAYIADLLDRLKTSGYLYQPERRMRVAMALFTLRRKNVTHFIKDIFDVIQASHGNRRFMHLFSKAFTEMLDVYIANESKVIDLYSTGIDRDSIYPIVRALGMRLLLTMRERGADDNFLLYRSMLYRYATLVVQLNQDTLLHKARMALLGFVPDTLEFSWADLEVIPMMCNKMGTRPLTQTTTEARMFEGSNAVLKIDGSRMSLMPLQRGDNLHTVADRTLFDGHGIRVLLNDKLQERVTAGTRQIAQFHRMWNEIEKSLFADNQNITRTVVRTSVTPDIGDQVTVRVLHNVPGDKHNFVCRIEDDTYSGEALLSPKQIVSYNIIALASDFIDDETGKPLLLRAIVDKREPSGQLRLNMRPLVGDFLKDELHVGEQILVQVSRNEMQRCLCIAQQGFTLFFPKSGIKDKVNFGDFVWVAVEEIYPDGGVRASYVGPGGPGESFQQHDAFRDLVYGYAGGKVYEEVRRDDEDVEEDLGDAKSAESFLEPDYVRELVHIIDRAAMLHTDHIVTYNLLMVAKILSRMLSDTPGVEYFTKRIGLVEAIRQFGDFGRLDDERLDDLLKENRDFMESYPDIKNKMTQLKAINLLDKTNDWDFLFRVATDDTYPGARDIARLVLSYNMLTNANQFEARKSIMRKIYQSMELTMKLPESNFVANEDQFTELKTSIIYPADRGNHMMANEKLQLAELMKVVSSLLNSKGGRLYVGVNDGGYAIGLDNDFIYLNSGHRDYDLAAIKDKFDRKFRDAVHNLLGRHANSLIEGAFENVGDMVIYRVEVTPSAEVVTYDGIAYERQGSSKWPIDKSKLAEFREARKKEMAQS